MFFSIVFSRGIAHSLNKNDTALSVPAIFTAPQVQKKKKNGIHSTHKRCNRPTYYYTMPDKTRCAACKPDYEDFCKRPDETTEAPDSHKCPGCGYNIHVGCGRELDIPNDLDYKIVGCPHCSPCACLDKCTLLAKPVDKWPGRVSRSTASFAIPNALL